MSDQGRPDVVLVHCHDLGRWLGVYGMPNVPSPYINRFARDAVVFDNAHAAAPLCSPARGALFTGMEPFRNGIQGLTHNAWRYRENVTTAPERLREGGFHSALIGLQHEDVDPTVLGFDETPGLGFLPRSYQVLEALEEWLPKLPPAGTRAPLFLTLGTWEVHRPWPAEDYQHSDASHVDVPPFLPDNDFTRRDISEFYGAIRAFDADFQRMLDALDRNLDPENTMIILTTDHGAAFPRAKSTLYDAGTGVALIVRPPRSWAIEPHRVTALVSHLDILPTLLDIAGLPPAPELPGETLLGHLTGNGEDNSSRMLFTSKTYHDTYDPKRAVRTSNYTYIRNYADGPKLLLAIDLEKSWTRRGMGDEHLEPRPSEEFYDRRVDPHELNNLADDPLYENVRRAYAEALTRHLQEICDPVERESIPPASPRSRSADPLPAVPRH